MYKVKVFFDNNHGVRVTDRVFSTRFKDEELASIVSVRVGREPLFIAGPIGLGLIALALQFGDLLGSTEQMGMIVFGLLLIGGGYSIATLTVGTLFNDKTVWWHDAWTIQKVRRAIRDAKHVMAIESQAVQTAQKDNKRRVKAK